MIGIISDTHGLVRPQALEVLRGADLIIHAGDIGSPEVLATLKRMAPVKAVRGNNDRDPWAHDIPLTQIVEYHSHFLYVLHELHHLDQDPSLLECSAVIFGHSHRPSAEFKRGVLYLNPGSAGPRRFSLPISLAKLHVKGKNLIHELIELSA